MSEISPSALGEKFDADFQAKLNACTTPEMIKSLMHEHEIQRGLVRPDWDPDILVPVEPGTAPRGFAKTIVVGNVKHLLESDSELGLAQAETALYHKLFAEPAATTTQSEQPRGTDGRFVEQTPTNADDQAHVAHLAELELKFKRGEISAKDYIQQSGAVSEYLEQAGVPLDELRASVAEKQNDAFQNSWVSATERFIENHPEWPGTDTNRDILGTIVTEQNWLDEDPLEALEAAYKHAVENELLVENPQVAAHQRIASANSPEEIRAAVGYHDHGQTSGLFGR